MRTEKQVIKDLITSLGFVNETEFKKYLKSRARLNESGAICYTEMRDGLTLNYSHNCKHKFGIGGYYKGGFTDYRF